MSRYSVILFDADGTLFDFSACEREAFREALSMSGAVPSDEMVAAYKKINDDLWKSLERGEIEREVLVFRRFEIFAERYGLALDAMKMAEDYVRCLGEKTYLIEGARELLDSLYGKVRMYIITNGVERVQRRRYELSGFYRYFDGIFISEALGVNKPDPRFFEYVCEHIDLFSLKDALVVGDSLSSDISGGIGFGLDTCWYNPENISTSLAPTYTVSSLMSVLPIILGGEENVGS